MLNSSIPEFWVIYTRITRPSTKTAQVGPNGLSSTHISKLNRHSLVAPPMSIQCSCSSAGKKDKEPLRKIKSAELSNFHLHLKDVLINRPS